MKREVFFMACGCVASGRDVDGNPVCAVHVGIDPGATKITGTPDLVDRRARCFYCKTECASSLDLAFFEHRSGQEFDSYYCGCRGWD